MIIEKAFISLEYCKHSGGVFSTGGNLFLEIREGLMEKEGKFNKRKGEERGKNEAAEK